MASKVKSKINRIIEITKLCLLVNKKEYPLLALDLQYSVGRLPQVEVTLSSALNLDNNEDSLRLEDNPLGTPAAILMTINYRVDKAVGKPGTDKGKTQTLCLFSGYILSSIPTMLCSSVHLAYVQRLRLGVALEAVDALPLGLMSYYNATTISNGRSVNYQEIKSLAKAFSAISPVQFNQNASLYLLRACSAVYSVIEDAFANKVDRRKQERPVRLRDAIVPITSRPTIQINTQTGLTQMLIEWLNLQFNSSSAANVIKQAAQYFFLDWMPVTLGSYSKTGVYPPFKMLLLPLEAWSDQVRFALYPEDLLSVRGVTSYKINSSIDAWAVSVPIIHSKPGEPQRQEAAIYAPSYRGPNGKAQTITSRDAFKKVLENAHLNSAAEGGYAKPCCYLRIKNIVLPHWLAAAACKQHAEVQNTVATRSTAKLTVENDPEQTIKMVKEWAAAVAKQSWMTEGMSQQSMRIKVPLWRWLSLLDCLGTVGEINQLKADEVNIRQGKTDVFYGFLSELNISIQINDAALSYNCEVGLSSVRDEYLQNKLAEHNVFYTCKNSEIAKNLGDAPYLADQLLALENRKL